MRACFIIGGRLWLLLGVLLAGGCGDGGAREDRSINYSRDGQSVGFQHGQEGVFVADGKGRKLEKIFQAEGSIAVSSPLWSPVDKRLIFSVAWPAQSESPNLALARQAWDADPAGRRFQARDIVYTCMMRPEASDDSPEPLALFQAACDHPGYVASNLAVRWHPNGKRVLFVDRVPELGHSLFEFDLETQQRRRILPAAGEALIFDWSPQSTYLVCMISRDPLATHDAGIWIRGAEDDDWWHVPGSEQLAVAADSQDMLERLRATQPAWTPDDQRLACVVQVAVSPQETRQAILAVDMQSRQVTTLYSGSELLGDLHWRSTEGQLGFVEGDRPASLRLVGRDGSVSAGVGSESVRQFVGWNHDGTRLAYIAPETVEESPARWALLFPPIPEARDRVWMMDGDASGTGRLVHEGVRITFPQWSPVVDELSLWGTYTPTHRSWLSMFVPWTLRPGDPAAILNCDTGEIRWMAVNAHEQAQVGHYYLMKRNYEEAWKWYERSTQDREPPAPIKVSELNQFLGQMRIHQNSTFFEYYCLTKLNRPREAAMRLEQFRDSLRLDLEDASGFLGLDNSTDDPEQQAEEVRVLQVELSEFAEFLVPLMQSAYATEVYLSLNAAVDGVEFFRRELKDAKTDAQRLAASVCLSQLLLIVEDDKGYAALATETLAPLLMNLHHANDLQWGGTMDVPRLRRCVEQAAAMGAGALALLPLLSSEFLDGFTGRELEALLARYNELRLQADNNDQRMVIDVLLLGILAKLGRDEPWRQVRDRVQMHPASDSAIKLSTPQAFFESIDAIMQQIRDSAQ